MTFSVDLHSGSPGFQAVLVSVHEGVSVLYAYIFFNPVPRASGVSI